VNRGWQHLLTIVVAGGVSFVITRWTTPKTAASQPPPRVVKTAPTSESPQTMRRSFEGQPAPHPRDGVPVMPPRDQRSAEERVAAFRKGLDDRFAAAYRDGSSREFEARVRDELQRGGASHPHLRDAVIACGKGICQIRLTHPNPGAGQRVHDALLSGEFLNTPALLNQDNGCNLHAFSAKEGEEDTFYVECREGRQ
jgi:hypothetical protein